MMSVRHPALRNDVLKETSHSRQLSMIEDGVVTTTSEEQTSLQDRITSIYQQLTEAGLEESVEALLLNRDRHISYLHGGLQRLPSGFIVLDSSRPWICFWIVHSLALMEAPLPSEVSNDAIIDFLASCQDPAGGFAGGPLQLAHLAPTYAAVASLVTLGGHSALSVTKRDAMFSFLEQRAVSFDDGGGFTVCEGNQGQGWPSVACRVDSWTSSLSTSSKYRS